MTRIKDRFYCSPGGGEQTEAQPLYNFTLKILTSGIIIFVSFINKSYFYSILYYLMFFLIDQKLFIMLKMFK